MIFAPDTAIHRVRSAEPSDLCPRRATRAARSLLREDRVIEPVATDRGPKAIGPYSQAVKANGFVFLSGQIALDPITPVSYTHLTLPTILRV